MIDLREPPEPRLAEQAEVDAERERAQARIRADVRGRLLTADVLLARRKGEHEAALAFRIDGLANQPARHLPHVLHATCEQADIRSAEIEPIADRLALTDHDVRAHLTRRRDEAERNDFGHD